MLTVGPDPAEPKSRNLKALEDGVAALILLRGRQVTGRNDYLALSNLTSLFAVYYSSGGTSACQT